MTDAIQDVQVTAAEEQNPSEDVAVENEKRDTQWQQAVTDTAQAQQTAPQEHDRKIIYRNGVGEIDAPVKVESKGITPVAEAVVVGKLGVLSVTPYEAKFSKDGLSHESNAALSLATSGVPGDASRVRFGLTDSTGEKGATTSGGWQEKLSGFLQGVGLTKSFLGVQGDILASVGEVKGAVKWNKGEVKADVNGATAAANVRLIASANVTTPQNGNMPPVNGSVAAYVGGGAEWKNKTKSQGDVFARAGLNASVAASDQSKELLKHLTPAQRSEIGLNKVDVTPAEMRNVVLPNGRTVDANTHEGKNAARTAFKALGKNEDSFTLQKANDGRSNISLKVGNFNVAGADGDIKVEQPVSDETGKKTKHTQVYANSDTGAVSRVVENGQTYLTPEALAQWINANGKKAADQKDPSLSRLSTVTADDLVKANPDLIKTRSLQVPATGADGKFTNMAQDVRLIRVGDVINVSAATAEGQQGMFKPTNLTTGPTEIEKKQVANKLLQQTAKMIEPTAINADGSVDSGRLAMSGTTKGFNGLVEATPRVLGNMVEGALSLAKNAISNDRPNIATMVRGGLQNLTGSAILGESAQNTLNNHAQTLKKLDDAETAARQFADKLPILSTLANPEVNKNVMQGLDVAGQKMSQLGNWVGDGYANTLGKQVEAARWYAMHGQQAQQQVGAVVGDAQQKISKGLATGTLSQSAADATMQAALLKANTSYEQSIQFADPRLQADLRQGTLTAIAQKEGKTVEQIASQRAQEQVVALQRSAPQHVAMK